MAINVSVQYNDGLLPDVILLTQCYYHRGTRLNAMKRFCICLYAFGCMFTIRGGYRMARGWHYAKLSLSIALRLSFSGMCSLLFLFLYLCRFCLVTNVYVPGQQFWSLITRAKPAKVLEPPLFGSRRGGLHAF